MSVPDQFHGWIGKDPSAGKGNLQEGDFTPKPFTDDDVDIEVSHCGICGSDVHTLTSGWGPTNYPVVVGHEIVGRAARVGKNVTHIKQGDICGVGAQSASCLKPDCDQCTTDNEQYCDHFVPAYNSKYADGHPSYGGYANYARHPGHFVIKIPENLDPAEASVMLCAGATSYSPLKRNNVKGKNVGIIGLGGLGHFGVLFARALGAKRVLAISRKESKREDALKLGADEYTGTDDDPDWATKHAGTLDVIVCTVSSPKMPLTEYLGMLRQFGKFIQLGAPEDTLPPINAFSLLPKGTSIGGSTIASPQEIQELLQLAADKDLHPWIQKYPMKDVNRAILDFSQGLPRYRFVLVNSGPGQL